MTENQNIIEQILEELKQVPTKTHSSINECRTTISKIEKFALNILKDKISDSDLPPAKKDNLYKLFSTWKPHIDWTAVAIEPKTTVKSTICIENIEYGPKSTGYRLEIVTKADKIVFDIEDMLEKAISTFKDELLSEPSAVFLDTLHQRISMGYDATDRMNGELKKLITTYFNVKYIDSIEELEDFSSAKSKYQYYFTWSASKSVNATTITVPALVSKDGRTVFCKGNIVEKLT